MEKKVVLNLENKLKATSKKLEGKITDLKTAMP